MIYLRVLWPVCIAQYNNKVMQLPLEVYEWLVAANIITNSGTICLTQESRTRKAVSPSLQLSPLTSTMDSWWGKSSGNWPQTEVGRCRVRSATSKLILPRTPSSPIGTSSGRPQATQAGIRRHWPQTGNTHQGTHSTRRAGTSGGSAEEIVRAR